MTTRQNKRLLILLAAAIGCGAVVVLVAGCLLPVRVPRTDAVDPDVKPVRAADDTQSNVARSVDLNDLQRLCAMPLRRPLFDAPKPQATRTTTAQPVTQPMTARLVGIALEPGYSVALFQKQDGTMAICAVGESFKDGSADVTVKQVTATQVTVHHAGRPLQLPVPVPPDDKSLLGVPHAGETP